MFYGIIVRMLFMDTKQHHLPHLHVEYQGQKAVICIPDGNLLEGSLPGVLKDTHFISIINQLDKITQ